MHFGPPRREKRSLHSHSTWRSPSQNKIPAEVLEEAEFEPFFTELESKLGGRKVALFGSYGWGDGQWMRDWVERTDNANANIYTGEGLMAHETPDEIMLEQCRDFGRGFAAY